MINKAIIIGRLTKDPELRKTQSGKSVCSYTLAVDRNIKAGATVDQDTDFINCVTWNRQAETMCEYLTKGSLIGIEGKIQTRSYENSNGQRVYVTEILTDSVQFLESKRNASQINGNEATQQNTSGSYGYKEYYSEVKKSQEPEYAGSLTNDDFIEENFGISSDDLPF